MRLLVVEDTLDIAHVVRFALVEEGYAVDLAHTATDGLLMAQTQEYDGIVLDVLLPDRNGVEVARQLRREGRTTPILMLTAQRETPDVVRGLDAGADDYLPKPFAVEELKARVRALTRRGERAISLTRTEFALLELFLAHPKQVLTRGRILEDVWGYDFPTSGNALEVYVGYLRRKTELEGESRLLHTVRGVGYVLRETPP